MENKNVLVISPEANVVFVGKYEKYVYFKNQLKEYNAEIRKKYNFEEGKNLRIYSEFTSPEELIIFDENDNNVYNCIIRVLINFFHRHEIEAKIKAEPFKNFKFEENEK